MNCLREERESYNWINITVVVKIELLIVQEGVILSFSKSAPNLG